MSVPTLKTANELAAELGPTRLDRYKRIYRDAYWKAWDVKADEQIERDALMKAHAHDAGLRAVILAVLADR